jgi:hypothetical protein
MVLLDAILLGFSRQAVYTNDEIVVETLDATK